MGLKHKLPAKARDLVEHLSSSAMTWGWQQDQGTGSGVGSSEQSYKEARAELEDYMHRQQATIRRLRQRLVQARAQATRRSRDKDY